MTQPTIGVLLPCRVQREDFLRDALASVLAQTTPDWRLLVILHDDSPASHRACVEELGDPRIELLSVHGGFAVALNAGLCRAESPFCCILLSDDRLHPRALEVLQREIRRRPRVDFFYTGRRYIDVDGRPLGPPMPPRPYDPAHFAKRGSPVKHLMCFRRERALAIGGMNETLSLHGCDDYDFPWRMAEHGARFGAIDDCLYEYRPHGVGPRLTTDVPVRRQVEVLRQMFGQHGESERTTDAFVQKALTSYLIAANEGALGPERVTERQVACHRDAASEALKSFEERGWARRHLFPHRVVVLPAAGPDGAKLAARLCGSADPADLRQVLLYALPPVRDEIPPALWFDDEIAWHRQQRGLPGHVAWANALVRGDELWVTACQSDLVQRIGRRREHKGRVESRFKGWARLLANAVLDWAIGEELRVVRVPTAELAMGATDPAREVGEPLFRRVYDAAWSQPFAAEREGGWWRLDVAANRARVVRLAKDFEEIRPPKTVCICHDTERGLGHRDDPAFAARADRATRAALDEMLRIERAGGVRATYDVVGELFAELAPRIAGDGHALAFHSWDHAPLPPPATRGERIWARLRGRQHPRVRAAERQLRACRGVDYRVKGYRPPQSRLDGLDDALLAHHNFEWLASSRYSLGLEAPRLRGGIVRIPLAFDDWELHTGALDWPGFEQRLDEALAGRDFLAFGLHDCYAEHWLPHYEQLLERLQARARLATLDEVAAESVRACARWVWD